MARACPHEIGQKSPQYVESAQEVGIHRATLLSMVSPDAAEAYVSTSSSDKSSKSFPLITPALLTMIVGSPTCGNQALFARLVEHSDLFADPGCHLTQLDGIANVADIAISSICLA